MRLCLEACWVGTEEICKLDHSVAGSVIVIGIIVCLHIKVNVRDQETLKDSVTVHECVLI